MKKNIQEEVARIKSMMKMVNEHAFDFDEPNIGNNIYHKGGPVKIIKSYNTVKELKNNLDNIESISGNKGLSGGALALIDDMSKDKRLPFHLVKNSKGEFDVCYDSDLYNPDKDRNDLFDLDDEEDYDDDNSHLYS